MQVWGQQIPFENGGKKSHGKGKYKKEGAGVVVPHPCRGELRQGWGTQQSPPPPHRGAKCKGCPST